MTVARSSSTSSLQDVSSTSAPHGLLLFRIPDYDAPLEDALHAIKRALVLVHRLTIVVSLTPSSDSGSFTAEAKVEQTGAAGQTRHHHAASEDSGDGDSSPSSLHSSSFHSVQRLLSALYVSFTKQSMALQRPLAELDIVFRESCGYPIGLGTEDEIPFDVFLGMPDGKAILEQKECPIHLSFFVPTGVTPGQGPMRNSPTEHKQGSTANLFHSSPNSHQGLECVEPRPCQARPDPASNFHTRPHT